MARVRSSVDFHELDDERRVIQYISYGRYDAAEKWVSLQELFKERDFDFVDLLYLKLVGRKPLESDRRLLLKTMMISSLGTGCHPPSVMVPKLIASTTKDGRFAIINGLIGSIATFGTDHLGSIADMMEVLEMLREISLSCFFAIK